MNHILLSHNPLDASTAQALATSPSCGAVSIFVGITRDNFQGKGVVSLEYEAYQPMAEKQLEAVANDIRQQWPSVMHVVLQHRLGVVPVTESSVIVCVSSPHRGESLAATSFGIDALKARVPIWKKEIYKDGTKSWKENKDIATAAIIEETRHNNMSSVVDPSRRVYRWAVNCRQWEPLKEEILLALGVVQNEEKNRILRFVFKDDAKRALAGRLLIRKCVMTELNACRIAGRSSHEQQQQQQQQQRPFLNSDFSLSRTAKGRPTLVLPVEYRPIFASRLFDFNVSHSGDYAVLAAVSGEKNFEDDAAANETGNDSLNYDYDEGFVGNIACIGIDVMKIEESNSKSLSDFFRLMRRQLAPEEWRHVHEAQEEKEKMKRFYRFWCLKESYVKAIGVGIGFEVGRLRFTVRNELRTGAFCSTTTVALDDQLEDWWRFDEMLLDQYHCVAIATRTRPFGANDKNNQPMTTVDSKRQIIDAVNAESRPISVTDDGNRPISFVPMGAAGEAFETLTTQLLEDFLDERVRSLASEVDWRTFEEKTIKS